MSDEEGASEESTWWPRNRRATALCIQVPPNAIAWSLGSGSMHCHCDENHRFLFVLHSLQVASHTFMFNGKFGSLNYNVMTLSKSSPFVNILSALPMILKLQVATGVLAPCAWVCS